MGEAEQTDAELVKQTLAGNREAFGCLYGRYVRMVRAVVNGVAQDSPLTHDLVQETFLRSYRDLARLRDAARFGAWIVAIARQVGRQHRRSLRRRQKHFRSGPCPDVESPASRADPVEAAEAASRVLDKLGSLPERERLAIHAFFLQGRDAHQAAALLGLSLSGFYRLLERALGRLAARMGGREGKEGN